MKRKVCLLKKERKKFIKVIQIYKNQIIKIIYSTNYLIKEIKYRLNENTNKKNRTDITGK